MQIKEDTVIKLLIKKGLITQRQVDLAKEETKKTGLSLEKTFEKMGLLTEHDIASILAESMGVIYVNLDDYLIDPEMTKYVPEDFARKHMVIPLFKVGDTLTVAMVNPKDILTIDELRLKSRVGSIDPVLSAENQIKKAIEEYYGVTGTVEDVISAISPGRPAPSAAEGVDARLLEKEADQAPVVKLVNMIISQAVKERASDIHIEPEEDKLRIRFRVDGTLRETSTLSKNLQSIVTSRVKIMSKMDISETRKPQDGRVQLKMEDRRLDLRVSSFPTIHGENIVIRILDKSTYLISLNDLGIREKECEQYGRLIKSPYGIMLVTGPTGIGKTTTLYASIAAINSMELNIITIEDPVEYEMPLIRQTQVNPKAGLTFATGLRAILRQDPDVIMVGEIRDKETAEIAIQASLTGHLVLSTLHTNDAPGSVARLIDMGIEPFLIASSIIGVLSQRLVRVICRECKESYKPQKELLRDLGIKEDTVFYRGKGCKACKNSGYMGRIGIFEFMPFSEEIKKLVVARAQADRIRSLATEEGVRTLRADGLEKAKKGITTIEEVLRVTGET